MGGTIARLEPISCSPFVILKFGPALLVSRKLGSTKALGFSQASDFSCGISRSDSVCPSQQSSGDFVCRF
jgi:hypothetical protein